MSEHTDFPPVLEALRDDLYEAMKAAGAASPASRRIRVVAALAGTQRRASVRLAIACGAAAVVVLAVLVFGTTRRGPSNAAGTAFIPPVTGPQRPQQGPPTATTSAATTALTISVAGRTWVLAGFGTRFTGRQLEVALPSRNQALQLQRILAAPG